MIFPLLLALLPAATAPPQGEIMVDRTMLVINDEVLTEAKLERRATRLQAAQPDMDPAQVASYALQTEIRRMVAVEGFRRFGLETSTIDRLVRMRLEDMQREDGSLARFESRIAADGYTLESMREAIREETIYRAWVDIVTGRSPSPTRGMRRLEEPTTEEIRAAYQADPEVWKTAKSLTWTTLSFFEGGEEEALETAQSLRAALVRGEMSYLEVVAQADRTKDDQGDPSAMQLRTELSDFLESAEPGDASGVSPVRGLGGYFVVLTAREEDREISFEEAQHLVRGGLMSQAAYQAEMEELVRLVDSSYVWAVPGVQGFLQQLRDVVGAGENEEL